MDAGSHLKNLLQTQLATDSSAVRHLPYCLSTLTAECLQSSSHLVKWTTRIHSLLHSKEPGGRWAGFCLAYKSSLLSKSLMIDSAQSWIGVALPLFSRNEPLPTIKAAIRLMRVVFSIATDIPEFHRQVSLPYVVKFTSALTSLADNHANIELKVLCLETLSRLIPIYPTTHRASSAALSAFTLRCLCGSTTGSTNLNILHAASQLYAILPLTGGKVGAVNLWRKSLDDTLAFGWEALLSLRTTFPIDGQHGRPPPPTDEPQFSIPLNQDRLTCSVVILCKLLNTVVQRPVQIPFGNLTQFIIALLNSSPDRQIDGFVDPSIRAMEMSAVPGIWAAGCELLTSLSDKFPHRLETHFGKLASILAFQLEKSQSAHQRVAFLNALQTLLKSCHASDSSVLPTRLAKSVLSSLTKILTTTSKESSATTQESSSSKSRNGKKRARNFEGDEVFNMLREAACSTTADGEVLLISVDILQSLFRNPNLSSSIRSIIARIVISILIALPRTSSSLLSDDPRLFGLVNIKIEKFAVMIGCGTTSVTSRTLPFVVEAALNSNHQEIQESIGMLLHPRLPPLLRSMPHVESLSLFKTEESQEETEELAGMGAQNYSRQIEIPEKDEDVIMSGHTSSTTHTTDMQAPVEDNQVLFTPTLQTNLSPANNAPSLTTIEASETKLAKDILMRPATTLAPKQQVTSPPISYTPVNSTEIQDNGEEDEEMPTIDMDSDSEGED